jgi:formate/nitrite transporter FocA (FNT family)
MRVRLHCRYCNGRLAMRYFVIAMLALIVLSLGSALYYLVKDRGQSMRTVKALALRVGLSITLFLILMASYYFGFITDRIR